MATTVGLLCEQIERLLYSGDSSTSARINRGDIKKLVEQEAVVALKAQRFGESLPEGDIYPQGVMIAEYDNVAVEPYKNVSRAKLPAQPISMPMGMGVWHVGSTTDIHDQYIPLQSGQFGMMKAVKILGSIVGYEQAGSYIIFSDDRTKSGVTSVYLQLLINDIFSLGDWDILPVPQDMEGVIVKNVYSLLAQRQPADRSVDQNDAS